MWQPGNPLSHTHFAKSTNPGDRESSPPTAMMSSRNNANEWSLDLKEKREGKKATH